MLWFKSSLREKMPFHSGAGWQRCAVFDKNIFQKVCCVEEPFPVSVHKYDDDIFVGFFSEEKFE